MSARIPFDDRLDLEEVEGLVGPSASTKKRLESSASGNRWALCLFIVGIILGVVMMSDNESLRFWEGNAGENVDDVEKKVTTLAPSVAPVPPPTPPPTSPPTAPPPTLPPTVAATPPPTVPPPTPPPTLAVTPPPTAPPPTPPPTVAATAVVPTPPPHDAATPPPTEAAVTPPPTGAAAATTPPPTDAAVKSADTSKLTNAAGGKSAGINTGPVAEDDYGAAGYPKPSLVVKPDPPLTPERSEALAKEWGKWQFVDKKADQRPKDDFAAAFPYRDVPRDKFPANAWQTDPEYLKDFLDEGIKLVDRSMEAILAEYGHGKKDDPDKDFDVRMKEMFEIKIFAPGEKPGKKGLVPEAGWTTATSFQGLVRRVLHAVMTNDNFTLVVGGHSAAAGHGNHFKQAYGMQFHKIMEPIFAQLGVKVLSRSLAQGGLGTLQSALGFKDIYGDSIDFMVWDSGMTEAQDKAALDIYWRQAIISGDRVPFLLGGGDSANMVQLNQNTDADIANYGDAKVGLPECNDQAQCEKFAYAARYIHCSSESGTLCAEHKFLANCWVDRPDVTPVVPQNPKPGSQVKWHPGFRTHQLVGRTLNMFVLKALKEGLTKWQQTADHALPDTEWHVTAHYDNIRTKLAALKPDSACFTQTDWPTRMCTIPINGHTEFTPRANPEKTSITSIIKPGINGFVPHISTPLLYTGPDVHNPLLDLPEGAVDVLAIISNGRQFNDSSNRRRQLDSDEIITGLGLEDYADNGYCDGTYNAECGRSGSCLLSGQMDSRGCIMFGSYSGWIVMTLPDLKEGIIVSKIESWHWPAEAYKTQGWTSINNVGRRNLRGLDDPQANTTAVISHPYDFEQEQRRLKKPPPQYCDDFKFDIAIDGKITTWDKDMWSKKNKSPQRVVELQTLLDDPNFTEEPKDVEVAIRMRGCGDTTQKTFCLSHIYYA